MDYVGFTERRVSIEASGGESWNAGTGNGTSSGSSSGPTSPKLSQSQSLALYLTRLLDEKIPFRKKVLILFDFCSFSANLYVFRVRRLKFCSVVGVELVQLKHIDRVATVADNGTVHFDVPGDVKPQLLDFGTGVVYDEESSSATGDEVPDVPPLQIVMLIVGTRGDVQPFVAIGKKLQVI